MLNVPISIFFENVSLLSNVEPKEKKNKVVSSFQIIKNIINMFFTKSTGAVSLPSNLSIKTVMDS